MFLVWEAVDFVAINKWRATHRRRDKFGAEKNNSVLNKMGLIHVKNNQATTKLRVFIA